MAKAKYLLANILHFCFNFARGALSLISIVHFYLVFEVLALVVLFV